MRSTTITALAAASATIALALTGCSAPAPEDDGLSIVASTNVYGSIAHAIAGDHAEVTNIIDSPAQDPHSYEASARDRLAIAKADIVIANGGGYDDFVDTLLTGAGNPEVTVLKAVREFGISADPPGPDFNEHVWYDLSTMASLADTLAGLLSEIDPRHATDYRAHATSFGESVNRLEDRVAVLAAERAGEQVAITEPVPLYLLEAAGFVNATPDAFSEAIEDGTGVPPALLQQMLDLMADGSVSALVYNAQTAGSETEQLLEAADRNGVAVVPVTETLPAGTDYLDWMSDNVTALATALEKVPQ